MLKKALNSRIISLFLDSMSPVFGPSPTLQAHSCLRRLQYQFAHHPQVRQRKHHQQLVGVLGQPPLTRLAMSDDT
jgi:hypothetical protein